MPADEKDLEQQAADWVARRDRGLTADEQDAFLQWLRDDPRRAPALARAEKAWSRLDRLREWRPAHSVRPNPDLLAGSRAPTRVRRRWPSVVFPLALAAAAAVAVLTFWNPHREAQAGKVIASHPGIILHQPRQMSLPDGSMVELDAGSQVEIAFVPEERRVQLVRGQAHFTVTKNPARPFVVESGGVTVQAVGTAFSVRRAAEDISVLVTEGRVRVGRVAEPEPDAAPELVAGQTTSIALAASAPAASVTTLGAADIDRELAWRRVRLEFEDMPLSEVAVAFNGHNRRQLVVSDAATGALRVGGNFHADNVDGFVRLLTASFGIHATARDDVTTVLSRGP